MSGKKLTILIGVIVLVLFVSVFYLTALSQKECRGSDYCPEVCGSCLKDYHCYDTHIVMSRCGDDGMCWSIVNVLCYLYEVEADYGDVISETKLYYTRYNIMCETSDTGNCRQIKTW